MSIFKKAKNSLENKFKIYSTNYGMHSKNLKNILGDCGSVVNHMMAEN